MYGDLRIDNPGLNNRDELCRQSKLLCPKCNKVMQMYYHPQCFHCKKPKAKEVTVVELFPALYYIENQGSKDFKEEFLKLLMKLEYSNDTYLRLDKDLGETEEEKALLKVLESYYPDYEKILWWVSW